MSFQPDLSILPPEQLALWPKLSAVPEHYVLYGGTAIALRLGHRQSVDFDFFTNEPFSPDQLVREMPFLGHGQRLQSQPNTLTVSLVGEESVGVSFLGDLKLGRVGVPQQCRDNGIWIADLLDLAATKMAAVQNRAEKKDYLDAHGGTGLIRQLIECGTLPDPMPSGQPFTHIEVVPVCFSPRRSLCYYGYGKVQLLYDCKRTAEHDRQVERSHRQSMVALRALSDENRMKILKLIAQNEGFLNGKTIAEKVGLSPSVVSRHLSQLKAGELIVERSDDNRNITYNFRLGRVRDLSRDIETYMRD